MNRYLVFHVLAELFSVIIAGGILAIAWNSRRYLKHSFFLLLGVGYAAAASLDLFHTLAFKGMGVFTNTNPNLPTQLWIAARYLNAVSLLIAPLFLTRRVRFHWIALPYAAVTAALFAAIFTGRFPDCFLEDAGGLTAFKIASEYLICFLVAAAILFLYRRRQYFDPGVLRLLLASMALTIAAELAFTLYTDVYGFANFLGHLLKIFAFALLYRAIIVTGLQRPFDSLFRDLHQSEQKYRELLETANSIIVRWDKNGIILFINEYGLRFFGYTSDELIGKHVMTIVPHVEQSTGRDLDAFVRDIVLHPEHYVTATNENITKDGKTAWLAWTNKAILDENKNVREILAVGNDITLLKQAEDALRESEKQAKWLARFPEENPNPVLRATADGIVLYRNPAATIISPWSCHPGRPLPHDTLRQLVAKAIVTGRTIEQDVKLAGTNFSVAIAPVSEEGYANIYARDITERTRAEEAVKKAREELELRVAQRTAELQRRTAQLQALTMELSNAEDLERKRLAEILHDDLQQMLVAMQFQLDILAKKVKSGENAPEMFRQLSSLLKESTRKTRTLSHELSPPTLHQQGLVSALHWQADQMKFRHGLSVDLDLDPDAEPNAEPLRSFLFKAVRELLFNVVKHAGAHHAQISLRQNTSNLELTVSDSGDGFDPLLLTDQSVKGFGLFSIRERLDLLGGRLDVRSAPGRGSTFVLSVPNEPIDFPPVRHEPA